MEGLILLAVLVCPVVMGTMMLLMWRGMRHGGGQPQSPQASASSVEHVDDVAVDDVGDGQGGTAVATADQPRASVERD